MKLFATAMAAAAAATVLAGPFSNDVLHLRYFNDAPGSSLTATNTFPSLVEFNESNLYNPTGFANRHIWNFSPDGTTDSTWGTTDYWDVSFNVLLNTVNPGTTAAPYDEEAGFILQNSTAGSQGDSQWIVKSTGEVAMFGGSFTFHQFYKPNTAGDYQLGTTGKMELKYFNNGSGNMLTAAFTYNGTTTSFTDPTTIYAGTHIGGYAQYQITHMAGVTNTGDAQFSNIQGVPEPKALLPLGLGFLAFLRRRPKA